MTKRNNAFLYFNVKMTQMLKVHYSRECAVITYERGGKAGAEVFLLRRPIVAMDSHGLYISYLKSSPVTAGAETAGASLAALRKRIRNRAEGYKYRSGKSYFDFEQQFGGRWTHKTLENYPAALAKVTGLFRKASR